MQSETLLVTPAKLVQKIPSAEFLNMAKYLKDNIEAERRWHSSKLTPCKAPWTIHSVGERYMYLT